MIQKNYHITSREGFEYAMQNIATAREYHFSKTVFLLIRSVGVSTEEVIQSAQKIADALPKARVLGMPRISFDEMENRNKQNRFIDIACTFYMESEVHNLYFPTSLDFRKLGRTIGKNMRDIENLKGVGIFFAGRGTQLDEFLEAATKGNEDIPFFGVLARDYEADFNAQLRSKNLFMELDCYKEKPFVVTDNRVNNDGLVLQLFIGEDLHIKVDYILGWKPIGRELKVTQAEGTRAIATINDMPAAEIYGKYLGVKPDSYFLFNVCEFPMIFNRNGRDIARVPPIYDTDGKLYFGADVREGEKFRFAYGNAHDILYQTWLASEEMRKFGPERITLHVCGNRSLFLKEQSHVEIDDYKRFLPSTTDVMGAGEIYCYHGQGGILNSSIVAVGMREGDPVHYDQTPCPMSLIDEHDRKIPLEERLATFLEVMTQEFKEMAINAKAASRAKSNFLSNMSHEIRTPINAILGMNEMILRESKDETILEYAENIRTASSTLLGLVNDILDFSKIEAGKMDIIPVEYDPSSILNDLVNMVKSRAEKKGLDFYISCSPEIPSLLFGDEIRIKQIATNILTNAVKYTETGSILLSVGCRKVSDDEIDFIFYICDTGIGIKDKDLSKLFSAFERIEEKRNRSIEGTGLGMNITHRLLELMNSKLEVESVYGEGSNFSFTVRQGVRKWIPIGDFQHAYHLMLQKHQVYHEKFTAPDAKILVVDDTIMNLKVIEGLLKQTKVQIDTATSGRDSLELVTMKRYDLIFLDHRMPEMDGIETLKAMQNLESNLNLSTPIISLTANAVSGAREMYIKAGFDDYLTKPVHSDQLETLMIKYLPPEKIRTADETPETVEDEKIPDWLKDFGGVNIETGIQNCGSIDGFLDALKIFFDSINSNADEIQKFFDDQDWKNYTVKVHALKSSAKIIGAMELSERARRLEDAGNQGYCDEIQKDTPALLELYRKYSEKLSPLKIEEDDSDLPEIDQSQLDEAYEAIREMSAAFDYDSVQFVFESLKDFRIPAAQKDRFEKIKIAAGKPDWEEVNNLLKAVVA